MSTMTLEQQLLSAHLAVKRGWVGPEDFRRALHTWGNATLLDHLLACRVLNAEQAGWILHELDVNAGTIDPGSETLVRDQKPPLVRETVRAVSSRYRKIRPHARGGLGEVFVAHDEELQREVALKEIQIHAADQSESRARFVREAAITGSLEHPGIVAVYSLGAHSDGRPYYAMRFIRGQSLSEAIKHYHTGKPAPLALRQLLGRFVAVCNAVAFAHSRGVIHRDIKPDNVMLGDFGETLVVDWGLARRKDEGRRMKDEGSGLPPQGIDAPEGLSSDSSFILHPSSLDPSPSALTVGALGTPAYMPPEQANGRLNEVGPVSDVFSLGATLYAILTGRAPYKGHDALRQAERGDWTPARQIKSDIPQVLEAICARAMAKKPEDRYSSARELATDVEHWLADEPVSAYREPVWGRMRRWGRRHRTLVTSAVVLLLVSVLGLIVGLGAVSAEQQKTARHRDEAVRSEQRALKAEKFAQENERRALKAESEAMANLRVAEANLRLARKAVHDTFDLAKNHRLLQQPGMQEVRKLLLKKALPFYKKFRVLRGDEKSREQLANQYARLGYITSEIGDKQEAREAYRQAEKIYRALSRANPGARRHRNALAGTLNSLGILLKGEGKRAEALKAYIQARDLQQELARDNPKATRHHDDLALTLSNMGVLLREEGKRSEALKAFLQAREIGEKLVRAKPGSTQYQNDLAGTLTNLAMLQRAEGKRAEALKAYTQAKDIREKLVKDNPNVALYRNALGITLNNMGALLQGDGKWNEALKTYTQARAHFEKLAKANPSVTTYQTNLARAFLNMGLVRGDMKQFKEALPEFDRALEPLQAAFKADPRSAVAADLLWRVFQHRAETLTDLKRHADATADWGRFLRVAPPQARTFGRLRRALSLARAGQVDQAMIEAEPLSRLPNLPASFHYDLACVAALCAAGRDVSQPLPRREHLAETCATKSLACLQAAHKAGFFRTQANRDQLRKDPDLAALRTRDDFKQFLHSLTPTRGD